MNTTTRIVHDTFFPIDHFGAVASPLIQALIRQDGNKRQRRGAFGNLVRIAKATKQIPAKARVYNIGLVTDHVGQVGLKFFFTVPQEVPSNAR